MTATLARTTTQTGGSSRELGFVDAVRLVAWREISQRSRDKSFLVSTCITIGILVAVLLITRAASGGTTTYDVGIESGSPVSQQLLAEEAQALGVHVRVHPVSGNAEQQVRGGTLDAVLRPDGRVLVQHTLPGQLRPVLNEANAQAVGDSALQRQGIDPAAVKRAYAVPPLSVQALNPPNPGADQRRDIARVGAILLYGQLIGYAMWVALGVVEEKSSRVVEVLLSTVRPRALLAGKVLGIGLLGLVQLLIVAAVGVGVAVATKTIGTSSDAVLPLALVLGWFVLGYAFYATAYAAAAARVSRQEDLQNVTTPMTLVLVASFFGSLWAASNPTAPLAKVLAVVPPFSALVNPPLVAGGDATAWQVILSIVLMLAAIAGLVVAAARLYEGAVLHSGSVVSLRRAWAERRS